MSATVFGRPVSLGEAWEDRSVYTFVLASGKTGEGEAAQAPSAPLGMHLAGGARGAPAGAWTFDPNVVFVREPAEGRDLLTVAREHREKLLSRLPKARVLQEEDRSAGGSRRYEREISVTLEHPLPSLKQWHVTIAEGDHFYHACCTATDATYAQVKPRFEELVGSWIG